MRSLALLVLDLGDSTFLLPACLIVVAWLAATGAGRRACLRWLAALAACVGSVAALKLAFMVCDAGSPIRPFSVSGHAAMAAFAYPAVAATLVGGARRSLRLPLVGGAVALACLVGLALVLHRDHTAGEVLLALAHGLGCAAATGALGLRRAATPRQLALVGGALALVLALGYANVSGGSRSPSEGRLRLLAGDLRAAGWDAACPFGTPLRPGQRLHWGER